MNINMTWKFLEPLISFITTHTLLDPLLKRGHPLNGCFGEVEALITFPD